MSRISSSDLRRAFFCAGLLLLLADFVAHGQTAENNAEFGRLDINGDGILSGTEVRTVIGYDTDGDGEVSRAEYDRGRAGEKPKVVVDRKGDPKEFQEAQAALIASISDRAALVFGQLDGNMDGWLSGTEIRPEHARFDTDGNNRITKDEFIGGMVKLLGFDVTPAPNVPGNVPPPHDDAPRPVDPAKPNGDAWVRTSLGTIGVTFETPNKPKYVVEKFGGGYLDASTDQAAQFAVRFIPIVPGTDTTAKAREELVGTGIVIADEKRNLGDVAGETLLIRAAESEKTIMWAWSLLVDEYIVQIVGVKADVDDPRTVPEFTRFFESVKIAPKNDAGVRNPPLPDKVPADSAGVHAAFVNAIAKQDLSTAYLMFAPEYSRYVDVYLFRIFMEDLYDNLNEVTSTGLDGFRPEMKNDAGGVVITGKSSMICADGTAEVQTTVMDGKIIDFSIHSPKIDKTRGADFAERINSMPDKLRTSFVNEHEGATIFVKRLFTEGVDAALDVLDEAERERLKTTGEAAKLAKLVEAWGPVQELEFFALNAKELDATTTGVCFTYKIKLKNGKTERGDIFHVIVDLQMMMTSYAFGEPFADDDSQDAGSDLPPFVPPSAPKP